MKIRKNLLTGLLVIIVVLVLAFLVWQGQGMSITTDKKEYQLGGVLRVDIKNNLAEDICFSSCYPYYLEKKDEKWQTYKYIECEKPDLAEKCIKPAETKGFEFTLLEAKTGPHRLAVPVCVDCKEKEEFKEIKRFYSNKFIIR